jgi:hypothetical protein
MARRSQGTYARPRVEARDTPVGKPDLRDAGSFAVAESAAGAVRNDLAEQPEQLGVCLRSHDNAQGSDGYHVRILRVAAWRVNKLAC